MIILILFNSRLVCRSLPGGNHHVFDFDVRMGWRAQLGRHD